MSRRSALPTLVDTDFKRVELNNSLRTLINLVHSFLKPNDIVIDFNGDGCVTSCFFNDIIVHEGDSNHSVFLPNDDTKNLEKCSKSCMQNIYSTSSKIKLKIFSKEETNIFPQNATTLLLESQSSCFQETFIELCSNLDHLRLVIFNTDGNFADLLQRVNTVLLPRDFYLHVVGKYTVYVKNVKPKNIVKINKTPQPSQVLIGIILFFCAMFVCFSLKHFFWP